MKVPVTVAAGTALAICASLIVGPGVGHAAPAGVQVQPLLQEIPVAVHAVNLTSTPVAFCGDRVVVVTVEEGSSHPNRLLTVIRIGERQSNGTWSWKKNVIEDRTLPDDYHTQPSVGVDRDGYVHVAYNMHNLPWQYVVSRRPCDIDAFEFRGQAVSSADLYEAFEHNRSSFPDAGKAAIPGNQITYPAFFNDRNGDLYITYRFAVRPARPWLERAFGAGIARYDSTTRKWQGIGGDVSLAPQDAAPGLPERGPVASPFAWQPGWTVYLPRLWFDERNGMHVVWTWRQEQAGVDVSKPSYAVRPASSAVFVRTDGSRYELPIGVVSAGNVNVASLGEKFLAGTSVTTLAGAPLLVLQPIGLPRALVTFDTQARQWRVQSDSPYGATTVLCENDGSCWAYASGPTVLMRPASAQGWTVVYRGKGYCDPKPLHDMRQRRRLLYVSRCDQRRADLFEITGSKPD